jgi:hypothetical protein
MKHGKENEKLQLMGRRNHGGCFCKTMSTRQG